MKMVLLASGRAMVPLPCQWVGAMLLLAGQSLSSRTRERAQESWIVLRSDLQLRLSVGVSTVCAGQPGNGPGTTGATVELGSERVSDSLRGIHVQ